MNYKKYIILSFLFAIFHGCATVEITGDKHLNLHNAYNISLPGKPWKIVKNGSVDLTMQHQKNNAMFAIISTPVENGKFTLNRLCKHLFIGIRKRRIVNRDYKYINHQRFLHTILEGEIDDLKVKISAYINSTDDFVYDMVYWSDPETFDLSIGDFEKMIKSLKPVDKGFSHK
ncbi:MAG: hypothetical protein GY941_07700 [Planctomycetes bacterium]|nr:hypothetical protein [Planctomycetota bacterium]